MSNPKKTEELLARAYSLNKNPDQMLDLYHDWAESYDESLLDHLGYRSPGLIARLAARYLPDRRARLLDIGCGTGLGGRFLAREGFKNIWGLDFSLPMLRVALSNPCYQGAFLADLNKPLPVKDDAFDAITCMGTFTHAHVGAGCIPALLETLRPGGHLICSVHHDVWESGGFKAAEDAMLADRRAEIAFKQGDRLFASDSESNAWFIVWRLI